MSAEVLDSPSNNKIPNKDAFNTVEATAFVISSLNGGTSAVLDSGSSHHMVHGLTIFTQKDVNIKIYTGSQDQHVTAISVGKIVILDDSGTCVEFNSVLHALSLHRTLISMNCLFIKITSLLKDSNSFKINPLSSSSSSSSSNSSSSSSSSEEASAHENEEASDNENEEGSDNESGYSSDANRSAVSEGRDEIAISHMPASEVPEDVLPRFIRDTKFISDEAMDDEDVGPF